MQAHLTGRHLTAEVSKDGDRIYGSFLSDGKYPEVVGFYAAIDAEGVKALLTAPEMTPVRFEANVRQGDRGRLSISVQRCQTADAKSVRSA